MKIQESKYHPFCTSLGWVIRIYLSKMRNLIKKPRIHQENAIQEAIKYFLKSKKRRGKLIMPCGTGKSLTSFWIAKPINVNNIIILVPSLILLKQTINLWLSEIDSYQLKCRWLCVCSDSSIVSKEQEYDNVIQTTQELGIPVTTNPLQIKEWFNSIDNLYNFNILFATYQSGSVIANSARDSNFTFDFGIFDEAHKTVGAKERAYILLPVIVDENGVNQFESTDAFVDLLMVLRALASQDERIIEYFRDVSKKKSIKARNKIFHLEMDISLPEKINLEDFITSIELKCWDRLAKLSWMPFEEAKKFIQGLGLKSNREWRDYCNGKMPQKPKKPADIPYKLERYYLEKGWISWGDILGTGAISDNKREYLSFEEALKFVRKLKLRNQKDWRSYCKGEIAHLDKKPENIPARPYVKYKDSGWTSFGHWLGTDRVADQYKEYMTFKEPRNFVHKLNLKSQNEWFKYCRKEIPDFPEKPSNIPAKPYRTYKDSGWLNWGDWLGTGTIQPGKIQYLSYKEAQDYVRKLKLKSAKEWYAFCKKKVKPNNIPANPQTVYKTKGWIDWSHWLGTKK
jgi:hypothetical protein